MQSINRNTLLRGKAAAQPKSPVFNAYPRVSNILVALFLGFIVFRYLEGGQRIAYLGRIRFELIVGAVLSVIGVVLFLKDKKQPATPALRWAIMLGLWMLVMVPMSADIAHSWTIFVDRLVKFMMITIFIAAFVVNPTILRWFFAAYLLAFAKMAQEGIHGIITGSLIWENQGVMRLHGPTWSYAHPNSFSGTQLGTLPYLYQFAALGGWRLRIVLVLQAVAALVIILYCGSRTAYLGFFAWLGILIARARSSFKAILLLLAITIAIWPLIPAQYVARLETVYTQKEIEGASIDTRKEILGDAWKIFTTHPLGVGVGAFPIVRERTFGRSQDTHNLYLEVATNLGFIGLTLFIGLVISMLRTLLAVTRKIDAQLEQVALILPSDQPVGPLQHAAAKHRFDLRTMAAVARATSSFLIIRLILGAFGHDLYEIYWWFILGLAVALNRMEPAALLKTNWLKEQTAKAAA